MFHSKGAWRLLLFVLVVVLCAQAASASASKEMLGLTASIESDRSFVSGADSATVRLTLRNDSRQDLYVPYWQTALRGIHGNLFDVRLNGKPAAYLGRVYKWSTPRTEDYVRIPAGDARTVEVDLSRHYDMTRTGEYSVSFRMPVQDSLRGIGTRIAAVAGLKDVESNVLHFAVERDGRGRLLQGLAQVPDRAVGNALTPGFVSCSSARQSDLVTALGNAEVISLKARDYLNAVPVANRPSDSPFLTWFGAYTSGRYSTVQSHFTAINSAFATKTVEFHCDCTDSAYAYVYTNQPYKIHLCNAFWTAPNLGIDSKAGTLVHEMSHFTVVAGTSDYAYGTSACQRLASSNPKKAINNADNHEYFAETR